MAKASCASTGKRSSARFRSFSSFSSAACWRCRRARLCARLRGLLLPGSPAPCRGCWRACSSLPTWSFWALLKARQVPGLLRRSCASRSSISWHIILDFRDLGCAHAPEIAVVGKVAARLCRILLVQQQLQRLVAPEDIGGTQLGREAVTGCARAPACRSMPLGRQALARCRALGCARRAAARVRRGPWTPTPRRTAQVAAQPVALHGVAAHLLLDLLDLRGNRLELRLRALAVLAPRPAGPCRPPGPGAGVSRYAAWGASLACMPDLGAPPAIMRGPIYACRRECRRARKPYLHGSPARLPAPPPLARGPCGPARRGGGRLRATRPRAQLLRRPAPGSHPADEPGRGGIRPARHRKFRRRPHRRRPPARPGTDCNGRRIAQEIQAEIHVVYCDQGVRGAAAVRQLHAQGFTQVFNLKGGLSAWRTESLPLQKPA